MKPPILVAEDEPPLRSMLALILESEGYLVQQARHGGEAVSFLSQGTEQPRILILDLLMPVFTGTQVLEWLSQQPSLRQQTRIIVLSGIGEIPPAIMALSDHAIAKPFNVDHLLKSIIQQTTALQRQTQLVEVPE